MSTSGTATNQGNLEKPPAAKQIHGAGHGVQSWEQGSEPTPEPIAVTGTEKHEPEIDDFGLPVKPPRRRSSPVTADDGNPQEEHGAPDERTSSDPSASIGKTDNVSSINSDTHVKQQRPTARTDADTNIHQEEPLAPVVTENTVVPATNGVSDWSHQALAPHKEEKGDHDKDDDWQDMPALAAYDLYDDDGKLIAREARESDDEGNAYTGLGGAGKGYTRVQFDEDARSTTSMDENTNYLFKSKEGETAEDDDEQRDPLAQMQATKDLLTEGQRIAYVGVTRLAMATMTQELESIEGTKGTKKDLRVAVESMKMWSQQMMFRLYSHMEIDSSGELSAKIASTPGKTD